MKQCVLYARVSLEEQADRFGLSSQQTELRTYAQKCGYEVLREFVDDGYSGGDLGRPALQQVRDLVRNRSVSLIVVHDPDRLARKLAHQLLLTEEFEKSGVRLEFVTTPNTDNMEGRLLLNVRGVIAEYEREKIRERTMRGRREKARQGLIVGGRCPYGYRSVGGIYQIEEDQAAVVRFIFQSLVEERLSIRKIIERLNESDFKPHTSTRWAKSSVGRILRNDLYTGKAYYNRRQRIEPQSGAPQTFRRNKKTVHQWRTATDWISISVPAIVDTDLFAAAQIRLRQNSAHCSGRPAKTVYLLRGILRCSVCGRRYVGVPVFKDKYYRCAGHERLAHPYCDAPLVAAPRIESFIWEYIIRFLTNPIMLLSKLQQQTSNEPSLQEEITRLENQIRETQRKEARLMDALLDGSVELPGLREKAKELAETRNRLQLNRDKVLSRLTAKHDENSLKERVIRYCRLLSGKAEDVELTSRQALVRALVDEVVLEPGKLTIRTILPVSDPFEYRPQRQ